MRKLRASQGDRLISSAGRAPASHAGGRRFDPVISHQLLRDYGRKSGRRAAVVQSVRIPACHAGGRGFESRPLRHICFHQGLLNALEAKQEATLGSLFAFMQFGFRACLIALNLLAPWLHLAASTHLRKSIAPRSGLPPRANDPLVLVGGAPPRRKQAAGLPSNLSSPLVLPHNAPDAVWHLRPGWLWQAQPASPLGYPPTSPQQRTRPSLPRS